MFSFFLLKLVESFSDTIDDLIFQVERFFSDDTLDARGLRGDLKSAVDMRLRARRAATLRVIMEPAKSDVVAVLGPAASPGGERWRCHRGQIRSRFNISLRVDADNLSTVFT